MVTTVYEYKRDAGGRLVKTGGRSRIGYVPNKGGGYSKGVTSTTDASGQVVSRTPGAIENESLARGKIDAANVAAFEAQKNAAANQKAAEQARLATAQRVTRQLNESAARRNLQQRYAITRNEVGEDNLQTRNQRFTDRSEAININKRTANSNVQLGVRRQSDGNAAMGVTTSVVGPEGQAREKIESLLEGFEAQKNAAGERQQKVSDSKLARKFDTGIEFFSGGPAPEGSFRRGFQQAVNPVRIAGGPFSLIDTGQLALRGLANPETRSSTAKEVFITATSEAPGEFKKPEFYGAATVIVGSGIVLGLKGRVKPLEGIEPVKLIDGSPTGVRSTRELNPNYKPPTGLAFEKDVLLRSAGTETLAKRALRSGSASDIEAAIGSLPREVSRKVPASPPKVADNNFVFEVGSRSSKGRTIKNIKGEDVGVSQSFRSEVKLDVETAKRIGVKVPEEFVTRTYGSRSSSGKPAVVERMVRSERIRTRNEYSSRYDVIKDVDNLPRGTQKGSNLASNQKSFYLKNVEEVYPVKLQRKIVEREFTIDLGEGIKETRKGKEVVLEYGPDMTAPPTFFSRKTGKPIRPEKAAIIGKGFEKNALRRARRSGGDFNDNKLFVFNTLDLPKNAVVANPKTAKLLDFTFNKKGQVQLTRPSSSQESVIIKKTKVSTPETGIVYDKPASVSRSAPNPRRVNTVFEDSPSIRRFSPKQEYVKPALKVRSGMKPFTIPVLNQSQEQTRKQAQDQKQNLSQQTSSSRLGSKTGTASAIGFVYAANKLRTSQKVLYGAPNPSSSIGLSPPTNPPPRGYGALFGGSLPEGGPQRKKSFSGGGRKKNKYEPDFTAAFFGQKAGKKVIRVNNEFALPAFSRRLI